MAAFEADVQQVGVHRVGRAALLVLHFDRDAVRLCVGQQLLARQQVPLSPRRDDLHIRHQRIGTEFEAHLIVALSGCTVRNRVGTGQTRDVDQTFRDQRARDRGAQQVLAFVDRIGAEHRKHEIAHEFFAQIIDVDVFRLDAQLDRLGTCRLEFFALPEIGGEGDDFAFVDVLQPFQDDRGIQPARIGKHHFVDVAHCVSVFRFQCLSISAQLPDTRPSSRNSISAFWACRRFSASSHTTEWGPSITSALTSSPR
jgi:hypothetical protein